VFPLVSLLFLALALLILATNILPARHNLGAMEAEKQRLEAEIRHLSATDHDLELHERALTGDPMTQEAEFRRTFRTGRPGETIYQFEEDALPPVSPADRR
jgi:cell division protein FtsB